MNCFRKAMLALEILAGGVVICCVIIALVQGLGANRMLFDVLIYAIAVGMLSNIADSEAA